MHSIKYNLFIILFFCLQSCQLISNKKLPASNNNKVKLIIEGPVKLNKKVLWNFAKSGEISVNGIALKMFVPVSEWIEKLGPARKTGGGFYTCYTWDKWGLYVSNVFDQFKDTVVQAHIVFHYRSLPHGLERMEDIDTITSMSNTDKESHKKRFVICPQPYFKGGVLFDSVVMGRGMNIEDFNKLSKDNGRAFVFYTNPMLPYIYSVIPEKVFPTTNKNLIYSVQLSEGYDNIERIWVDYNYWGEFKR